MEEEEGLKCYSYIIDGVKGVKVNYKIYKDEYVNCIVMGFVTYGPFEDWDFEECINCNKVQKCMAQILMH